MAAISALPEAGLQIVAYTLTMAWSSGKKGGGVIEGAIYMRRVHPQRGSQASGTLTVVCSHLHMSQAANNHKRKYCAHGKGEQESPLKTNNVHCIDGMAFYELDKHMLLW